MKFISKSNRLTVILQPGISEDRLTGRPARPQVSVRFDGGLAEVKDQSLTDLMISHPGMGKDFICADEISVDPYKNNRKEAEPAHLITEMRYGTPEKSISSPVKARLTPEMERIIDSVVQEKMSTFLDLLNKKVSEKVAEKGNQKKKPMGRPPKKKEEIEETINEDIVDETASIENDLS